MAIETLRRRPYSQVLAYPSPDKRILTSRTKELKTLDVKRIVFEGPTEIAGLRILGKGCVSIAVKALTEDGVVVLKIRRVDANRASMMNEARLQQVANQARVGPKLKRFSRNCILMEYVEGQRIVDWIRGLRGKGMTERLRQTLKDLLRQCFELDRAGLDHGELSNLSKHVIINQKPIIIDFESASISRRMANLTSAVQFLFVGGPVARRVRRMIRPAAFPTIVAALRSYKHRPDHTSYMRILAILHLTKNN